jgi:hypothetical protein
VHSIDTDFALSCRSAASAMPEDYSDSIVLSTIDAIRYSSDGIVRLMLRLHAGRAGGGAVRLRSAALRFKPVGCAYSAVNGLAVTQDTTERLEGPFKWDMRERTLGGALYGIDVPLGRQSAGIADTPNWMRQTHTFDLRSDLASDVVLTCAGGTRTRTRTRTLPHPSPHPHLPPHPHPIYPF